MGSLLSCAGGSHDKTPTSSGNNTRKNILTGPGHDEWNEDRWRSDSKQVWCKALPLLPTNMDIPRLGLRTHIFNAQGDDLLAALKETDNGPAASSSANTSNAKKKSYIVEQILYHLGKELNDEKFLAALKEKYYTFVNSNDQGDISQQLLAFFKEAIPEDTPLCNVLKCCHQKIIFPGFYSIKNRIGSQLPFKDKRGTWNLLVYITKSGRVVVKHRKHQLSKSDPRPLDQQTPATEGEFFFEWELLLVLSKDLMDLERVDVAMKDLQIRDWVDEKRANEIRQIFETAYPLDEQPVVDFDDESDTNDNESSSSNGSGNEQSLSNDSGNEQSLSNDSGNEQSLSNDSGNEQSLSNDSGNEESSSNDSGNEQSSSNDSGNNNQTGSNDNNNQTGSNISQISVSTASQFSSGESSSSSQPSTDNDE